MKKNHISKVGVWVKKLVTVFCVAFILNFVWEHAHSVFYVHYKGEEITSIILFRAAIFDAFFITVLGLLAMLFRFFEERIWILALFAVLFAVCLELFALSTRRWEYTENMPLVPFLGVGLTPAVQLGILAYLSLRCVFTIFSKERRME